jgi:deazaflavin-dependent oxidoreductase (nitroreductase family)
LTELGYEAKTASALQRGVQTFGATRAGAWIFQRALYPMDKMMYKSTHGRVTVAGLLGGLPVIMLTTTGAKTGKPRSMPLIGFPTGDSLTVLGTNFGQKPTPGWVYNLRGNAAASVGYRDHMVDVTARRATDVETDEAFRLAATVYPGYKNYRSRATNREILAFVLDATQ